MSDTVTLHAPAIGWIALGSALLFGAIVSSIGGYNAFVKDKKKHIIDHYESINHALDKIVAVKKAKLEAKREFITEYNNQMNCISASRSRKFCLI